MDEQAGPGVFFNNNNNSGLSGGGNIKAPQAGDVEGAEAARAQYNIPGILHFLQHEWARFEVDKAHWEVERAELQAQIAFLQGERRGQENLKKDLVRRIKMLEYVLKQERAKYHKTKYGTELNQGEIIPPSYDSGKNPVPPLSPERPVTRPSSPRYLQEVGYTDTILDVKSQRVRALLGLTGDSGEKPSERKAEPMVNGTEPSSLKDSGVFSCERRPPLSPPKKNAHPPLLTPPPPPLPRSLLPPLHDDPDTEEALKGFDFLASPDELDGSPESRSGEDSGDWGETRGHLRGHSNHVRAVPQITNNTDALRKTWNPKFTLRSHFDSVRGLAFHPVEPVLVTASEDHTLKLWNLQKTAPAKKCTALDVEPIYTFRAHSGAVLCVTMSSSGEQCFSGGVDGTVQSWNTPSPNIDPYDSYEPSVLRGALCGHADSVWGLVYSSAHQRLLSCSADGTVRLWNAADTSPALAVFNERGELGVPTSVDLVSSDPAHMVTSFSTGSIGLFNMETQQLVLQLESAGPPAPCRINKVLSHPTLPITITAQEDRHIQFFDNNTGKAIHSMVAHLDAVTCLAVDPNGLYLMSGSHDCSIRLWNMESKTCIQEFTAHRKKSEESIHDVAFHPTKCYIGSAGADALAKVFV
uniref:Striatin n=1 Tax=Gasterosteus aculeatus aculeatus TaxID=481459 RepID=A0AAQ4PSX8_GASAC